MKTFRQHFTGGIRGCKYVPVNRNSERRPSPRFVPLSSPHRDRFVLKGAMLFTLWSKEPHRKTRDLDLLGFGAKGIPEWEQVFRQVCLIEVEPDGLEMLADSVRGEIIRVEEEYAGTRIKLMAMLGKARIPLQIDVGFGDAVTPPPQEIAFPTMLDFPAPPLRAYRPETVIAEKFHAMVDLGLRNTRMKDFYDVWKLSQQFEFDGETMVEAIRATFSRRQTVRKTSHKIDTCSADYANKVQLFDDSRDPRAEFSGLQHSDVY